MTRRGPLRQPISRPPLAQQPRWRHRHRLGQSLVIDIYVRVSLVGIELLAVDARIVISSVDTYLRFAEAVN
jgi:hypothetical protein